MRSLVNAMLQWGLVTVPVGVAITASRKEPQFRTLHEECMTPVKQNFRCPKCNRGVEEHEKVKGFEFVKGQFLKIDSDDISRLQEERSRVIVVGKIVPWDSIDETAIEKSYYLTPNRDVAALAKPYNLFSRTLFETESAAVAKASLWGKEYPAMIWPKEGGALVLSMLFCHDEIVSDVEIGEILSQQGAQPTDDEREMAREFVAMRMSQVIPQEDMRSSSRERMVEFLAAKTQGLEFEFAEPEEATTTFDLLDRLRATVEGEKVKA